MKNGLAHETRCCDEMNGFIESSIPDKENRLHLVCKSGCDCLPGKPMHEGECIWVRMADVDANPKPIKWMVRCSDCKKEYNNHKTAQCPDCFPDKEKRCVCGEQVCLGGAEVEIGGVCHRPNNPCYHIERNPTTDILIEKKCNHQFWRDRNPPNCLNCGKTEAELDAEHISSLKQAAYEDGKAAVEADSESFCQTIVSSPEWAAWEKEVARRMAEHSKKESEFYTGCWDVDESRELGLISKGHWAAFVDFIREQSRQARTEKIIWILKDMRCINPDKPNEDGWPDYNKAVNELLSFLLSSLTKK